ncbi:MAG: Nif3-like dinuclear metal center hexameric protein [Oscillospiraceae bacterium]
MVTIKEIYDFIDGFAPFKTALSFDNCGLLIGNMNKSVEKIMLALDASSAVLSEAYDKNCTLIITHHPIIFHPLKQIRSFSPVQSAIKKDIAVLSAHTNLDVASCGVNDVLAKKLELGEVKDLVNEDGIGKIGTLSSNMSDTQFAKYAKEKLNLRMIKFTPTIRTIRSVAVIGGSGGDFLQDCEAMGADAVITGEGKHNNYLEAVEKDIFFGECGHFETEVLVLDLLKSLLEKRFSDLQFIISQKEKSPICIL